MELKTASPVKKEYQTSLIAIQDSLDVIAGKWRMPLIITLAKHQTLCFKELKLHLTGISSKVLSSELKTLEQNSLISRTELNVSPPKVEYRLTEYGMTLGEILYPLLSWGLTHRQKMLGVKNTLFSVQDFVNKVTESLCHCAVKEVIK